MVAERIFGHLAVLETHGRDALENPHQLLGRIGIEFIFDLQIGFEVHHEVPIYLTEQDVVLTHLDFQKLLETAVSQIVFIKGGLCKVDTDQFLLPVIELFEDRQ